MSAPFELTLLLPHDHRFAPTLRDLAIHAAEYAGCPRPQAEAFGRAAEELLRESLANGSHVEVPVVVRRAAGPLELVVDERVLTLEI
jgi:hypothetical protein